MRKKVAERGNWIECQIMPALSGSSRWLICKTFLSWREGSARCYKIVFSLFSFLLMGISNQHNLMQFKTYLFVVLVCVSPLFVTTTPILGIFF
jgi:hypothetical protein